MPFKSRKQQQWYHATDQKYLDKEPHSARKVEGEAEDQSDLTTSGDIPEHNSLATPAGEVTQEEKEVKRGEQTPISQDDLVEENLIEFEGKVYSEVRANEDRDVTIYDAVKKKNITFKVNDRGDVIDEANEESSVAGPSDGMRVMDDDVLVLPNGKVVGESVKINENYIEDQFGKLYRPVYVGENRTITDNDLIFEGKYYTSEGLGNCAFCQGAGKITVERLGIKDCPDCDGTGDIQEQQPMMGGGIDPNAMGQPQPMEGQQPEIPQDPMQQEQPMEQQPDPNQQIPQQQPEQLPPQQQIPQQVPQQPQQIPQQEIPQQPQIEPQQQIPQQIPNDPSQPTDAAQIPQQPSVDPEEQSQPMEKPEDKKPMFGEAKLKDGYIKCDKCNQQFSNIQWLLDHKKEQHGGVESKQRSKEQIQWDIDNIRDKSTADESKIKELNLEMKSLSKESFGKCKHCGDDDFDSEEERINHEREHDNYSMESKKKCVCERNVKKYKSFISNQINVLKRRAKAGESVGIMYGLPTISKNGRKIKGTLAYAGVSLNDRIYLPETLAKGDGRTLPLLLNHSCTAGAEAELDRLSEEMQNCLYEERDYQVGEVSLSWDPEKLTLFYEGVVEDEFFQKEIDDMDMAVSLGIYYDSDSPKICDENCYTVIKGAEFREVSLVYHAGFPIATIEAVETELKKKSLEDIYHGAANTIQDNQIVNNVSDRKESTEDHLELLDELKDEEETEGEPEHVEDVEEIIDDVKADEEIDPLGQGGSVDVEPVEEPEMMVESFYAPQNFSVTGITAMTISNTNGVQKYTLDPNMSVPFA